MLGLPPWTLSARLEADILDFCLGDGRRLAWRSRRPAALLQQARHPLLAARLLGPELADRLAGSAPRALNIQVDEALDAVAWEELGLGSLRLAEHFIVARQLMGDADPPPPAEAPLADALAVAVVYGAAAVGDTGIAPRVALDMIAQPAARDAVLSAHLLVLDGITLAELLACTALPCRERLLVLCNAEPHGWRVAALDQGAALLAFGDARERIASALQSLMLQLGGGASVGEALHWLHRHADPSPLDARLYGDPALRFVALRAPASRRQVTSLSFDIVGSTAVMGRLGDEAYAELLASLHARCRDIVHRRGGLAGEPRGSDGVMNYFGHPSALEDAAVHAVGAGLEIVQTVSALGVAVRVGIATGPVAIRDGQPVGLSIHLAARLQGATAPGTVLVSEVTQGLVAHAFELEALAAPLTLKGIAQPERVCRVLGAGPDARAHRLGRLPWLTPLVGRQAELERLGRWWVDAGDGGPALVCAEAGMGKSRLVREFRRQLDQGDAVVLECHCRADASASAYLALAEALKHWLGIGPEESADGALRKLAAALPDGEDDAGRLAWIAALLGLAPPPLQPAPGGGQRQRMLALLLDCFAAWGRQRPGCLIVEDWHWVDPSTRAFVEQLVKRGSGAGFRVVLTLRVEAPSVVLNFDRAERIDLTGLPAEAARELVSQVCAKAPLPTSLVRQLAARGDGVPLFLEEAARMALELGADRLGADPAALEAVPASLQDLLMARLDGLGFAKPAAQVAAVLGREFSRELLAALLENGPLAPGTALLGEQLATLEASGLVRAEGGGRYAFRHALIRDTAYASLWARDRHALHAQVVLLLQQRWPEMAARRPELLAQHQTEAGLHIEALAQWELAARSAAMRSAESEAVSHLRRAIALLAHLEPGVERDRTALRLQLQLAARLIVTEGYGAESVLQAYLEAARLCERLDDETARFRVEMGIEAYRFMRADFGPALEHGRRAAAIAAASGDVKQRLHAHWGLACTMFHQGDLRATMREMETGLALYTPALHPLFGVQDPGVMCLAYSSWGLWELGRPDAALARIQQAIGIGVEFKHKFSQVVAMAYCVSVHLLRGEPEAALARADACIRVCEEAGFPVWLAITRCMRGRVLCEHGDFDVGLGEMRAGYAQWLATGAMVSRPLYLALQAEGLVLAGQPDAALACVNEGLEIVARFHERQYEAELRRLCGDLLLARGDAEAAERWLKSAYAVALRRHRLGFALRSATSLARLWAADGRRERARRLLAPLLARWREGRGTRDVRAALALCESLS